MKIRHSRTIKKLDLKDKTSQFLPTIVALNYKQWHKDARQLRMLISRSMQIFENTFLSFLLSYRPCFLCILLEKWEKKERNQNILFMVRSHENKFIFRIENCLYQEQLLLHILSNVKCFAIIQDDELGRRSTVSFIFRQSENSRI